MYDIFGLQAKEKKQRTCKHKWNKKDGMLTKRCEKCGEFFYI